MSGTPPRPPAKTRYLKRLEFQIEVKGFRVGTGVPVFEHESGIDHIDARDTNKAPGYYVETIYTYKEICRIVCLGPLTYAGFLQKRDSEIHLAECSVRDTDQTLCKFAGIL